MNKSVMILWRVGRLNKASTFSMTKKFPKLYCDLSAKFFEPQTDGISSIKSKAQIQKVKG